MAEGQGRRRFGSGTLQRDFDSSRVTASWSTARAGALKRLPFLQELYYCIISTEMEHPMAQKQSKPRPASVADPAAVLTKATLEAATRLGLTNKLLATVIGVSEATVSRMRNGVYTLQRGQK